MHLTRGEGTSGSQRETKNMEIEREVRQGTHTDQPQCECLTTDVEYLGIGGISISTIKYAENLLANKRKKTAIHVGQSSSNRKEVRNRYNNRKV